MLASVFGQPALVWLKVDPGSLVLGWWRMLTAANKSPERQRRDLARLIVRVTRIPRLTPGAFMGITPSTNKSPERQRRDLDSAERLQSRRPWW